MQLKFACCQIRILPTKVLGWQEWGLRGPRKAKRERKKILSEVNSIPVAISSFSQLFPAMGTEGIDLFSFFSWPKEGKQHGWRYCWVCKTGTKFLRWCSRLPAQWGIYPCNMGRSFVKNRARRAFLVAQWLRICLPRQETRVQALVREDPTCRGATRPVSHNYWACASGACARQREAAIVRGPRTAMKSGPLLPQLEKALAQKRRPNTAINK